MRMLNNFGGNTCIFCPLQTKSIESIDVIKHLEAQGEKAWLIGEITHIYFMMLLFVIKYQISNQVNFI
jgi:hypothetical protein